MTTEKYETKQMKEKLAEYFMQGDLDGAKEYFLGVLEKRPDVLMEASDITGELKLAMQVIAVCELERQEYGDSVLDRVRENYRNDSGAQEKIFAKLMRYFGRLNEIVSNCRMEQLGESDIEFLQREKPGDIAVEASARLFVAEKREIAAVMGCIGKYR